MGYDDEGWGERAVHVRSGYTIYEEYYEWELRVVDGHHSVPSMTQAPMKLYKSHSAVAGAENEDELHSMVNNIIGTLKRTTSLQKSKPPI